MKYKEPIGVLLLFAGVFTLAYFVAISLEESNATYCAKRWEGSGYPTKWEKDVGCKIKVDDRWILEQHYRHKD